MAHTCEDHIRIGAAILARNMSGLIGAAVKSLSWTDGIFLYDDGSVDGTAEVAQAATAVTLMVERSSDDRPAFVRGQCEVRNHIIARAFESLECNALLILDADELMLCSMKRIILESVYAGYDSISLSIWHIYDDNRYIRFRETCSKGLYQLDPHVRVITPGILYTEMFGDGSHPIIRGRNTRYIHGHHHFHLKYFYKSPYPNNSLYGLPERLSDESVAPYLAEIPFRLPFEVQKALSDIDWDTIPQVSSTPSYNRRRLAAEYVHFNCRHYRGFEPCIFSKEQDSRCPDCTHYLSSSYRILVIANIKKYTMSNCAFIINMIKELYTESQIYWILPVDCGNQAEIIQGIYSAILDDYRALALLTTTTFDIVVCFNADIYSAQLATMAQSRIKKGFGVGPSGVLKPFNLGAHCALQDVIFKRNNGTFNADLLLSIWEP